MDEDIVPVNLNDLKSNEVITSLEQVTPVQVMEQGKVVVVKAPIQLQPAIEAAGQLVMPCLNVHKALASNRCCSDG